MQRYVVKEIKVIFKLDDFRGVTKNIIKLDKIIRDKNVKITWGIIGEPFSLVEDTHVRWMKRSLATGLYSYWNHGYTHAENEFKRLSLADQIDHLKKTQEIIKNRLGFIPLAWGSMQCNK